jgi:hypothetical protein
MREIRNGCNILIVKAEGRKSLAKSRRRWENNIEIDFKKTGHGDVDWIHLAQVRVQRHIPVKLTSEMMDANRSSKNRRIL